MDEWNGVFRTRNALGGNMRVGSLVKHIEFECIGIATKQGVSTCDKWLVVWTDNAYNWYTECELEVLCE